MTTALIEGSSYPSHRTPQEVATAITNAALATSAQAVEILAAVAAAGGSGSVEQTIRVHDGDGNPVAGVMVKAQGNNGGTQTTNNGGSVVLMLNPDTYVLTLQGGPGYVYDNPRSLVVTDGAAQTFIIEAITIPASTDPAVCRCFRYLAYPDGTPLAVGAATLEIEEIEPPFPAALAGGNPALVVPAPPGQTDGAGYVYVDVPKTAITATLRLFVGVGGNPAASYNLSGANLTGATLDLGTIAAGE